MTPSTHLHRSSYDNNSRLSSYENNSRRSSMTTAENGIMAHGEGEFLESSVPKNLLLSHMSPGPAQIWQAIKAAGGLALLGSPVTSPGLMQLGKHLNPAIPCKYDVTKLIKYVSDSIGKSPLPVKRLFLGGDYGDRTAVGAYRDLKVLVYLKDVLPPYNTPLSSPDQGKGPLCTGPSVIDLLWRVMERHNHLWREFGDLSHMALSAPARCANVSNFRIYRCPHWVEVWDVGCGLALKVVPVPWISTSEEGRQSVGPTKVHFIQQQTQMVVSYLSLTGEKVPGISHVWRHSLEEARCLLFQNLPPKIIDYIRAVKYIFMAIGQEFHNLDGFIETMALLSVLPHQKGRASVLSTPSDDVHGILWTDIVKTFDALACLESCLNGIVNPSATDIQGRIDKMSEMVISDNEGSLDLQAISSQQRPGATSSAIFTTEADLDPKVLSDLRQRATEILNRLKSDRKCNFQRTLQEVDIIITTQRSNLYRNATTSLLMLMGLLMTWLLVYHPSKARIYGRWMATQTRVVMRRGWTLSKRLSSQVHLYYGKAMARAIPWLQGRWSHLQKVYTKYRAEK